ncbi:hypothetical protein [Aureibacter tunicatorum]|uniref:Uncharacterized protein n=1 Tax=Aureibacter tunicatorum TaxID=866807 RepID=A0AAE4BUU4_9BACT|nr:hypothetical protein [Aureibacter tunicatorum]MDR6241420.1 hypothetical protein [Aureibacter tunicatorum]BDD06735.1 hypothetical protein AUTU_42180 [Aureibacter tunicatorum]
MINTLIYYWRIHRLSVAVLVSILAIIIKLAIKIHSKGILNLFDLTIQSIYTIGFSLVITPLFLVGYYMYSSRTHLSNNLNVKSLSEVFTRDNLLIAYTVYLVFSSIILLFVFNFLTEIELV